jgi:hypothetical protein
VATAAGQAPSTAAQSDVAPTTNPALKTAWGDPDLQGIWNNDYQIPLQRPDGFEGKAFLTEQERAALDAEREKSARRDNRPPRGSQQDVAGAYNAVFNTFKHTGSRTSLIVDPPDGRIPPLTEGAKKLQEMERSYQRAPWSAPNPGTYNLGRMNRADGPEDRSEQERCMGSLLPDIGAFFRLVQSPTAVTIYYEHGQGGGNNRIITLGNGPHLPSNLRQWNGDARGHWEGNTLVVDTTNFTAKLHQENLHLVERFTRTAESTLKYEVTREDPTTWTKPWTVMVEMNHQSEQANRLFESSCHEGNFGLTGMLQNTRIMDAAFAEGRGPDPRTQDIATGGIVESETFVEGGGGE